ncbi:hypothetical protein [Prochlorococcus marinus]|uniref:hypothetical protein n=1 Tax=Prochlorococcus marinus TaxID=1219 RepID=UPI0022B3AD26|nr:hypothetical protein [Prochlorococcus marinus]
MIFKFIFKRQAKKPQKKYEQKFDMNNWMSLTKEERFEIDFKDKNEIMKKKKALLRSIREEYNKIKNKNFDKEYKK